MSDNREIEVKLYTPDLGIVRERLHQLGATLHKARLYERNVRYEDKTKTLKARGIVVRLREDDDIRLTYKSKGVVRGDGLIDREELEVNISDFATMEAILARLGFHADMVYEKYRTTYQQNGCEIVLDEMPYGNFTEIEGEPDMIESLVIALDLQNAPRYSASYARIFDVVRQALGLDFHDLTFANFEAIDVSQEILEQAQHG
jgi:adenylate cyclase class 2